MIPARPIESSSGANPMPQRAKDSLIADDIHDFLRRDIRPRELLLSPWLMTQGLVMVHAWRGVGKTHLALGVAYAVSTGGHFLDWSASGPRRVLYIDGEMPASIMQTRLAAVIESNEKESAPGMLRLVTPDIQLGSMPDLASEYGQDLLDEIIEPDTALIILDNLSALCRTGKENEAESWLTLQSWALRQRASGRSVLFIHHSGKDLQQRGTSRREDLLDVVISLRRPAGYRTADGAVFEVHFEKTRHLHGEDAQPIRAVLTTESSGRQLWTVDGVAKSTFKSVVSMANAGLTQKQITSELGIDKSNVSRAWNKALKLGLLVNAHG